MDWLEDEGRDVTSAFMGITTPVRELLDEIHGRGWTVTKVDTKDHQFFCQAKNPHGESVEKTGPTESTAIGNALLAIMRQETMRYTRKRASWGTTWDDQLADVAHAYAEAPVYDPKAASAWKELADDLLARTQVIQQQVQVEVVPDPHPYSTVQEMTEDIRKNRHVYVSSANAHHPLWSTEQVVAYRLCRDVLGHAVAGGDYGWHGENQATAAMMPMLSPNAQKALFTESIGQAAYNGFYRALGPQKITFLDEALEDAQGAENDDGHGGLHPSQSIIPGMVPDLGREEQKVSASSVTDPNAGWSAQIPPNQDNAFLWQKEDSGLDPLDWQGVRDHAALLDTGWHRQHHPDGSPDLDTQKQAVVNALRATLLAPRKNDRWGATHYQHVAHLPANVSDPQRYWEALEGQREHHNQARGMPEGAHRALWQPERETFRSWVKSLHPSLDDRRVDEKADRELFHMLAEEEERIAQSDPDHKLTAEEIEQEAHKSIQRRLKQATKPSINQKTDFGDSELIYTSAIWNQPDPAAYGSFLASHIKPLAAVSNHADDLVRAARQDVANNGGKGHHWRKTLLDLGIQGVGPKEASHSWLLLQPQTSQLGVIDPHTLDILGHRPEDASDRDYFKHERELSAGRDAAGYGHIPLGQFGWGLWDYKRLGHGNHQDRRPWRVLNPQPHHQVDFLGQERPMQDKWQSPYWWDSTQEARDQVGKQWDEQIGVLHPKHEVPFQKGAKRVAGLSDLAPWYVRHDTGESDVGAPGESIMAFIKSNHPELSTEEIWALNHQAGKH